ncbi:MAG: acetate--CoA ligase family protein [Parcubacteria group bacterium]|jgi:acetyltransferase
MKKLESLFNPKSIAIVGASPKRGKLGNILAENIKISGWKGQIYPVNPKYAKNHAKYFASLQEIKKKVDLVLVAIPATAVSQALLEGATASPKISNFAVISSGFKEAGTEGKKLESELVEISEKYQLNILGPNCLGFINPKQKLNATFTSGNFKPGKVAIVSQSGALAVALLDWTESIGAGLSKVISIGNKSVVDESDVINYLAGDKDTHAIALYLEDIKSGGKFIEALTKLSGRKPVVVIKAGKNKLGQKAISSHTGSLAQDESIIEAAFKKFNLIQADNIPEFQDLIEFLSFTEIPRSGEIIVVTNAGGPGVLASDFIGKSEQLSLLELPTKVKNELKTLLPAGSSVENPIDILGDATPERYQGTLEILSKYLAKYPTLAILTPQSQTDPDRVAQVLVKSKKKIPVLLTSFLGGKKVSKAKLALKEKCISDFSSPEEALAAMEKILLFRNSQSDLKKRTGNSPKELSLKKQSSSIKIFDGALREKRHMLFWNEAEKIFNRYKIPLLKSTSFAALNDPRLKKVKFPCVLKTDDPKIAHRWDKKGVVLNISNFSEFKKAYLRIKKNTKSKNFLIQPMQKPGLELILGMKRDSSFGLVIIIGLGGTYAEIFRDRVIFIPPVTPKEILRKLRDLKMYPILKGYRGEKGYNLQEIANVILRIQQLASENPEISEIDINPFLIYNDGRKGQVLDAKVYLA